MGLFHFKAIIKVRGANVSHWNKRFEEVFAEAFAATVNEDRQEGANFLFGAGDVQVLRASQWKASDDSLDDLEVDEELGMQLVVETSIFNYNAIVAPGTTSPNSEQTLRLVQTAGNNFFSRSKYAPISSCNEADLHQLANSARDIHTALAQPNFVARVMDRIKVDEASEQMQSNSPFFNTVQDAFMAQESSVVTSWTIKTDIGSGYSRGLDFIGTYGPGGSSILLLFCSVSAVIGYIMWIRRNKQRLDIASSSSKSNSTKRRSNRSKYSQNEHNRFDLDDDDAESILSLLSDTSDFRSVGTARGNMELVAQGDNVSVLSDLMTKGGH